MVAILAPETSFYLVVIYIELPFHSLCKQFTIITVVFIGLLVQKAKFLLYHGNQHEWNWYENTDFCIDIMKSKLQEKVKFDQVVQSHVERARLPDYWIDARQHAIYLLNIKLC